MRPGGDGLPRVYAGSMVVQGGGTARVLATGIASAIGQIGHALATVVEPASPLKRQTAALVRWFAVGGRPAVAGGDGTLLLHARGICSRPCSRAWRWR